MKSIKNTSLQESTLLNMLPGARGARCKSDATPFSDSAAHLLLEKEGDQMQAF
jgi:hypothetical protein